MTPTRLGTAAIAAVVSFLVASPLLATPPKPSQGVLVTPARLDLAIKPGETSIKRELTILNQGVSPDTFAIRPTDLIVTNGTTELLPSHSTPYAAEIVIAPQTLTLAPGTTGKVTVTFDTSARPVFFGGLVIGSVSPPADHPVGGVGILVATQIVVPVSGAPVDAQGELLPEINLTAQPAGLRIPWLLESGPINVSASARNTGNIYQRQLIRYEFSNLGRTFLTVDGLTQAAMPNGIATTSTSTLQHLERGGGLLDTAPLFCVCKVRAEIRASIAGRATQPVVQEGYVLVLPYRGVMLMLAALIASILARRLVLTRVRRTTRA